MFRCPMSAFSKYWVLTAHSARHGSSVLAINPVGGVTRQLLLLQSPTCCSHRRHYCQLTVSHTFKTNNTLLFAKKEILSLIFLSLFHRSRHWSCGPNVEKHACQHLCCFIDSQSLCWIPKFPIHQTRFPPSEQPQWLQQRNPTRPASPLAGWCQGGTSWGGIRARAAEFNPSIQLQLTSR